MAFDGVAPISSGGVPRSPVTGAGNGSARISSRIASRASSGMYSSRMDSNPRVYARRSSTDTKYLALMMRSKRVAFAFVMESRNWRALSR